MRKILLTGAAGLLGQALVNRLIENHELLCIDIAANPFSVYENLHYIQADLTDFAPLRLEIANFRPDFIYNCAAYSDVDGCEVSKQLAEMINIDLVKNLLDIPFTKLIHYSSDYVFNGQAGPYAETDPVDPLGYYGWTKLQSEHLIQKSAKNCLIIRTNVLYGTGINTRPDFMRWVAANLQQGRIIRVVADQFNNPTYASSLAQASIEAAACNLTGIWHLAGPDYYSRFEIANIIANLLSLDHHLIRPVSTIELGQPARRPQRGGLKTDKAAGVLKTKFLSLKDGLKMTFRFV